MADGLLQANGGIPAGNRGAYFIQSGSNLGGNGSYQSPYLMSMAGDGMTNNSRHGGAANVLRRGRNYLEEYKN